MKVTKFITIAFVMLIVILLYIFPPWVVKQNSMLPSVRDGDILIGCKLAQEYEKNDVVVCKVDNKKVIKRVIATAGDCVVIEDNVLTINGVVIEEDYLYEPMDTADLELIVPDNSVFVLGDNRNVSDDSREFGCINIADVVGKVILNLSEIF